MHGIKSNSESKSRSQNLNCSHWRLIFFLCWTDNTEPHPPPNKNQSVDNNYPNKCSSSCYMGHSFAYFTDSLFIYSLFYYFFCVCVQWNGWSRWKWKRLHKLRKTLSIKNTVWKLQELVIGPGKDMPMEILVLLTCHWVTIEKPSTINSRVYKLH